MKKYSLNKKVSSQTATSIVSEQGSVQGHVRNLVRYAFYSSYEDELSQIDVISFVKGVVTDRLFNELVPSKEQTVDAAIIKLLQRFVEEESLTVIDDANGLVETSDVAKVILLKIKELLKEHMSAVNCGLT